MFEFIVYLLICIYCFYLGRLVERRAYTKTLKVLIQEQKEVNRQRQLENLKPDKIHSSNIESKNE